MKYVKKMLSMILVCCLLCVSLTHVEALSHKTPTSALNVQLGKTYTRLWNDSNYNSHFYNYVYVDHQGELKIRVSKPVNNAGDYENIGIHVYDANNRVIWTHRSYVDDEDISKNYYEYKVGVKQGYYYIDIVFDGILWNDTVSSTYSFVLDKNEYVEIENNERVETSCKLNPGHMYKGNFGSSELTVNDHDIYKFNVLTSGNYEIVLNDYRDFENTWVLMDILDENRKELDFTISDFKYNSKLKAYSQSLYLDQGTYYIDLHNNFMNQIPYNIGVYNIECLNKGHQFFDMTISEKPTETTNGLGVETCGRCGHNNTRVIPRVCKFSDVTGEKWYFDTVLEANKLGLMSGATDTLFKPDANMNRAMAAVVFHRMDDSQDTKFNSCFSDVKDGQYYSSSVSWAKNNGVINGYKDGTFKPLRNISREEMATMIVNFVKYKNLYKKTSYNLLGFKDYSKISSYALESINWCVANGLLSGKDNGIRLDPLGTATRAESTKMLLNAYKYIYK